ncbi:MAG TPA: TfoX/Sxy family protein [Caulobacteraceae bacterium]
MAWQKSPQGLVDLFAECLPQDRRIEQRRMFGYPAAFTNGNMFAGLFGDGMFARLSPSDRQALESEHGPCPFEPMPGRPMKDYARVPDAVVADEQAVADLIERAFAFCVSPPPKVKKPRKREARR